jgi:hypothetical protein
MKFVEPSHFTDPDAAARKLLEIANATEPAQDGRIYIELVNAAFLKAGCRQSSSVTLALFDMAFCSHSTHNGSRGPLQVRSSSIKFLAAICATGRPASSRSGLDPS